MSDEESLFNTGRYVSLCPSLQRDIFELAQAVYSDEAIVLLEKCAGLSEEEYLKRKAAGL